MTESEAVGKLQELCGKLAAAGSIAEKGELPEVFGLIGSVLDSQHQEIDRLRAQVAKLEAETPVRAAAQNADTIEAPGFVLKTAAGKTVAELTTNDTGSQLLLYGTDGKRKALLSTTLVAGFANVPRLDLFDHHQRLRVRLGVYEPTGDAGVNPHGPPQLIFFEENGQRVSARQKEMWFFGEDNAEVAAVEMKMTNEGLKLTAYNQEAGVVYSAVLGKAAPG